MTCDPSGIGSAPPAIFIFNIKNILQCAVRVNHIAAMCVYDTFWSASSSRCIENEKWIFSVQLFGGIGFTWEHDLHLYYRRAKSDEILFGDATFHRSKIAAKVIDGA